MRKALIVAPSWIGDAILAQPLFARLHARHPGLVLDACARPGRRRCCRACAKCGVSFPIPSPTASSQLPAGAPGATRPRRLRRGDRPAEFLEVGPAAVLRRHSERIGFTGEARTSCSTASTASMRPRMPQLAQLRPARRGRRRRRPPACRTASRGRCRAQRRLAALGLDASAPVAFCPGAEYGWLKRWPARHSPSWRARLAATDFPCGSSARQGRPIGAEIEHLSGGAARNLCEQDRPRPGHRPPLCAPGGEHDSGLMHVAAALDRSLVALYARPARPTRRRCRGGRACSACSPAAPVSS